MNACSRRREELSPPLPAPRGPQAGLRLPQAPQTLLSPCFALAKVPTAPTPRTAPASPRFPQGSFPSPPPAPLRGSPRIPFAPKLPSAFQSPPATRANRSLTSGLPPPDSHHPHNHTENSLPLQQTPRIPGSLSFPPRFIYPPVTPAPHTPSISPFPHLSSSSLPPAPTTLTVTPNPTHPLLQPPNLLQPLTPGCLPFPPLYLSLRVTPNPTAPFPRPTYSLYHP